MGIALRLGNFLVAKTLQFIFNTTRLTDMGCTLKLYKKRVIDGIKSHFKSGGNYFSAEIMALIALHRFNIIEIPVNYRRRVGESTVTGHPYRTVTVALKMIVSILWYALQRPIAKE